MSSEKVHFQPTNCRIENAAMIDAEALKEVLARGPLLLGPENPKNDQTVYCSHRFSNLDDTCPVAIKFFLMGDIRYRECCEKECPHLIPIGERDTYSGFAEWPENSHFFGS